MKCGKKKMSTTVYRKNDAAVNILKEYLNITNQIQMQKKKPKNKQTS